MTSLRSGSATDVGRVRTSNQDVALEDPDLFAVADGMGGHVGGEVAARVAVDTLRASFQRQPTVEGLRRAVAEANRAVWRQSQAESGLRGMGTTLTATALVSDAEGRQVIALANVGDSRAYVYSRGQVIQVTADHSLAEERVRQGVMTEAEAAVHPHRHILTRALGVASDVDVDLWELHLRQGDRILICSDGLTNEVGDDRIGEVLASVKDPHAAAQALVETALEHGGSDNVTVIVVDVVDADGSAAAGAPAVSADEGPALDNDIGPQVGDQGGEQGGDGSAITGDADRSETAFEGATTAAVGTAHTAGRQGALGGTGLLVEEAPRTRAVAAVAPARDSEPPPPAEVERPRLSRRERRRQYRMAGIPRMITVRVVLFLLLLMAVLAAAYGALRWYAMHEWYVGLDHQHLAIYQGHPGGFLWFKPRLVDDTKVMTSEVLSFHLPALRADKAEPTESAARRYIADLYQEYQAFHQPPTAPAPAGSP